MRHVIGNRPCSRRRAFTVTEAMIATTIVMLVSSSVLYAIVAGQAHAAEADKTLDAIRLAEDMLNEIRTKPYFDNDSQNVPGPDAGELNRTQFDNADDYDRYTENSGQIKDFNNDLYPLSQQGLNRSVAAEYTTEEVEGFDTSIDGLRVTVTVSDARGRQWQLTQFIPED